MSPREQKLLLLLVGVAGVGAWFWFSKSGQALLTSGEFAISTGVQKLSDLNDSTLQLIIKFESFSPTPYFDRRGYSIGYGHFMGATATIASMTKDDAYDWLRMDAQTAADAVKASIRVPLSQNQFDALVSFAYNVGIAAFKSSTLVRKINSSDPTAVDEFARWNKSNGEVLAVLTDRRAIEAQLFAQG